MNNNSVTDPEIDLKAFMKYFVSECRSIESQATIVTELRSYLDFDKPLIQLITYLRQSCIQVLTAADKLIVFLSENNLEQHKIYYPKRVWIHAERTLIWFQKLIFPRVDKFISEYISPQFSSKLDPLPFHVENIYHRLIYVEQLVRDGEGGKVKGIITLYNQVNYF